KKLQNNEAILEQCKYRGMDAEELWRLPNKQIASVLISHGGYTQIATCCCFRSSHLLMISFDLPHQLVKQMKHIEEDAVHIDGVWGHCALHSTGISVCSISSALPRRDALP
ncbi:MAG: hypothetical protein ACKPKO_14095, partial [Candidatus Fonsibacter sp.]